VRYHLGELYEDYVTETTVSHKSGKIESRYANRPIEVEADERKVMAVIEERLRQQTGGQQIGYAVAD
jgi:hypothetical protein